MADAFYLYPKGRDHSNTPADFADWCGYHTSGKNLSKEAMFAKARECSAHYEAKWRKLFPEDPFLHSFPVEVRRTSDDSLVG